MHCHSNPWYIDWFSQIGASNLELLSTVFMIAVLGSFLHCIGMCGPIASAQFSMRLMQLPNNKATQAYKLRSCFVVTYYLGKIISYIVISSIFFMGVKTIKDIYGARYILILLFIVLGVIFILTALNVVVGHKVKFKIRAYNYIANCIKGLFRGMKIPAYGWSSGILLGFIPCGYLYSVLGLIALRADGILAVLIATVIFGFGTIPGLYLVSYFGNIILYKWKKVFQFFFSSIMLFNGYLLIMYAFKLM